ncbi:autotransporter outer membrane beta-barrel domain-containing protein, partial [Bosea caraganae]|uniref:autotransporter outer membrane beta-barrel domain-containing protein n=1 Tax=Bosea caraganae TaxID=2763117 RepID=UPI0011C0592E
MALASIAAATSASAADLDIISNVSGGVNLDTQIGSTVEISPGITVTNAAGTGAMRATTSAWALTNRGSLSSSLANTVSLSFAGSSVSNFGTITAGSVSNAIALAGGGSVDNQAGATINSALSAIMIGIPTAGAGSVTNVGTITQTGTAGDLVSLRFGGIVTNLFGGTITANNSSNAVAVGQGASRTVINSGTIINTGTNFAAGVLVQGGASTVTNTATGRISGAFNGVYASASAPLTFTNDGLIESTGATGARRAVEATGGGTFVNTGTIRSIASDGLYLGRAGTVTNSGTVSGAVNAINFAGNFARTLNLDTGSTLTGNVQGGSGTDALVLLGSGSEDIGKFLAFESLSMQGASWQLDGAGAFSSSVSVQSGALSVSGTMTSPTTTIQTNGTLGGTGTIMSTVSVAGTLLGMQGQTLTMASLDLAPGARIDATLGAPGTQPLFNVTGALVLDGSLNISAATGFGPGVYRILSYGGGLTDNGLDIGSVPAGTIVAEYTVQTAVPGQVNLVSTATLPTGPFNFWDGAAAGNADNRVIDGGSGTWSATAANWTDVNGALNTAMAPQPGFAIFQSAGGSVTVDNSLGAVTAAGMQFASNGYTVLGGDIILAGPQSVIRVGDGTGNGASYAATIAANLTGSAELVKSDLGTLILAGANSYTGGTTVSAGRLLIGAGGTTGSIQGDVVNNATLGFNRSDAVSFAGTISGSGTLLQMGSGTTTLTGVNSYAGGTTVMAGTLRGQAASFGSGAILNNAALVIDQAVDASFANAIDGIGSLAKAGAGSLDLTGTSGLSGSTVVAAGKLSVNGSLANSAVTVLDGATLAGTGVVGATTVQSGATISPGNSIGTLTINGNLVLAPGSTYAVEIAGNGAADRIVASGSATVAGSRVAVGALDPQTSYLNGQRYTIITATGGVGGSFTGAATQSAFLDLALDHRPNQVDLVIQVKGSDPVPPPDPGTPPVTPPAPETPTDPGPGAGPTPAPIPPPAIFETVARTRNQFATAHGLDTLPQMGGTLALYNSLLMLDAPSARAAFDALSGEIHASAKGVLVEEGSALRDAATGRLRSAFGAVGAAPMATMNYGFTADLAPSATGPMPKLRSDRFALWGQGYGSWGRSESDRNAGKLTRSSGGLMVGGDVAVFDNLRFGALAGY